jgi:hypothetical protein
MRRRLAVKAIIRAEKAEGANDQYCSHEHCEHEAQRAGNSVRNQARLPPKFGLGGAVPPRSSTRPSPFFQHAPTFFGTLWTELHRAIRWMVTVLVALDPRETGAFSFSGL